MILHLDAVAATASTRYRAASTPARIDAIDAAV
jgi:hypothetical protein